MVYLQACGRMYVTVCVCVCLCRILNGVVCFIKAVCVHVKLVLCKDV